MDKVDWISHFIESRSAEFMDIQNKIWDYAEIRFKEIESAVLLMKILEENAFTVEKPVAYLQTAFKASFGHGKPIIGLLAEYDALSGLSQCADERVPLKRKGHDNGHGCGHHALGTAVIASAIALKAYMEAHHLSGQVVVLGCPGEEGGSGKTFMAREGVFNALDVALTWHPMTHNAIFGSETLANCQVYFKFKGISAHAAASPHLGRSALDAVELMNVGTNFLREHMPLEARVHYAITDTGGRSPNVVQAEAEVLYLIRAPKISDVNVLYERVCDIAQGAALMTGTQVERTFDKACSNYIPNQTLGKLIAAQMQLPKFKEADYESAARIRETFTSEEVDNDLDMMEGLAGEMPPELRKAYKQKVLADVALPYSAKQTRLYGSTDVGDVSWIVPTAQFYTASAAIGTAMHTWQMVSQGKTATAHAGMIAAAKTLALTGICLLEDTDHIMRAKEEHLETLQGKVYVCPIPNDVYPKIP
ncbi:amidohydrolase [Fusibacter sp. 3D3]|uniref:amidohydrolase n=1 Tax=Fusibacter sp. 3D3 TaxID=1048380 RepID=UPI0008539D5D|nr:amidohydrolase [Fusibacter sp. 3D3]GAU78196.1 catalyzes the cleavage of p-aminobenzoyl-glutamate to p-aminobenzoate and glutamate subunit B [Fusibacter sp. 3D3]